MACTWLNWTGHGLVPHSCFRGFLIESNEELEQLKTICAFVFVDAAQSSVDVAAVGKPADDNIASSAKSTPELGKLSSRDKQHPAGVHATVERNVGQLLVDAKEGKVIDVKESRAVIARLVQQSTNQNLMMQMLNLRNRQDRHAEHSLNTAILAIAFGRYLGHSEERLRLLGLGAILHDIGKARVPSEILNKSAKLTDAEFEVMKRHPAEGYEMLKASSEIPDEVLDMVRFHHERVNGSGYPNGLQGDQIPVSTGIISIADAYETLTADNPYQPALVPVAALQRMRTTGTEGFGQELMQEFMRFLGLYPVGSVVKLNSGDIAIVFSSDPKTRMRPLIMLVRDEQGTEIRPRRLVNLASLPEGKLSISGIVDPKKYAIDTAMLFEKELQS